MTPPPAPTLSALGPLDTFGLSAWESAWRAAVEHRVWRPIHVIGLEILARRASNYVNLVRAISAQRLPADDLLKIELHSMRRHLREQMRDFCVLPADASAFLGEVRPDGMDSDIAELCGVAPLSPQK
jgi:FAD/FMN-containing dehydrogenase